MVGPCSSICFMVSVFAEHRVCNLEVSDYHEVDLVGVINFNHLFMFKMWTYPQFLLMVSYILLQRNSIFFIDALCHCLRPIYIQNSVFMTKLA